MLMVTECSTRSCSRHDVEDVACVQLRDKFVTTCFNHTEGSVWLRAYMRCLLCHPHFSMCPNTIVHMHVHVTATCMSKTVQST